MARNVLQNVLGHLSKAKRELEHEAKSIAEQLSKIEHFLSSAGPGRRGGKKKATSKKGRGGKRHISAAGRARIAAAQRRRWAKVRAAKKASKTK